MNKKKQYEIAKRMFKISLVNGQVSPVKARLVLSQIVKSKQQNLASILKIFKKRIETALSNETVIIEASTKTSSSFEKQILEKTKAKKIIFKQNPQIVFGARITHGDWVWDATLDSKLEQIKINN